MDGSLKFKRLSETRFPGIITLKYQALAQNNGMCVECHITDTMPSPPNNVQVKPILVIEPSGVMACR